MKKILYIVLTAVLFTGCNKELTTTSQDGDLIKVGLSLTGEVSVSEEPLTKSGESDALLGIQVYQGTTPYAWGLFDTTEGLNLYLHSGAEYSIVCQYIKNGKRTLYHFNESSDANITSYIYSGHTVEYTYYSEKYEYWKNRSDGPRLSKYSGFYHNFHRFSEGYSIPFDILDGYTPLSSSYDRWGWIDKRSSSEYVVSSYSTILMAGVTRTVCAITNKFVYTSHKMNVSSSSVVKNQSINDSIDRYYGESGTFTASSGSGTISLDMKHLVYGIQCNVTGVSDGTATITIKNGNNTLLEKSGIASEYHSDDLMFAFSDMHSAWQYSDNYTENITISMTWLRGVGVTQNLGSQVVQVKRNCMNVINVSLSATKAGAALGVESESTEMSNESVNCSTHF